MDYKIILPDEIPSDLVRLLTEIDEFKGRWWALKNLAPDRLSLLQRVASVASIGSSTRIEGAKLSDAEVEALLSKIETRSFRSRDEEEVAGYADAMNMVFESYKEISITENHIKQLHRVLLKHSTKDARHTGEYKKMPNSVEAFDAEGKGIGVIFETATPFLTPFYMNSLVAWYETELKEGTPHPLLVIGTFVVHFLAIHPFQDGNGRLSRILTTLMLLRHGYLYVPYCSLESVVEQNKDGYYLALRKAQASFTGDHGGLGEWLRFFLATLKKQKDILAGKIEREEALSYANLPALSVKIVELVRDRGRCTMSDLVTLTGANRNSLKTRLRNLVAAGFLQMHGTRKGAWYSAGHCQDGKAGHA